MKKFGLVWLIVSSFFTISLAQSGRKITTAPNPSSTVEDKKEPNYSESTPTKTRSIIPLPSMRGGNNSSKPELKSNNPTNSSKNDGEIIGDEVEVLKVDTSLITIPISVFDRNGLYIPNLTQENFKIFEDGKEQEIAYLATSEQPFTVVLLIDVSPSTAFKIEAIQDAAIAFVNQLKAQDSVMVIEFDQGVHVLSKPTNDRQKLAKAIRKADFGNGTSLYDAVDDALRKKLSKISGRKAIVLFTDGVDTTSYKQDYDSTLRLAEESDSLIFPIYYNTFFDQRNGGVLGIPFPGGGILGSQGNSSADYALGRKYLEDLSAVTGGRVFKAGSTNQTLIATFESIAEELRRQYNIGYYPSDTGQAGQRKQIKVRVNRPNLVIRARDSYIVGDMNKTQTTTSSKSNFK
jgi:VWFA-related protein